MHVPYRRYPSSGTTPTAAQLPWFKRYCLKQTSCRGAGASNYISTVAVVQALVG